MREWQADNKEKTVQIQSDWRRDNPDKMREYRIYREQNKTHTISLIEWEKCKKYFDYRCAYCNMSEKYHKKKYKQQLHKEHVDHEGSNALDNCVPSCKSCNSSKRRNPLNEWYTKETNKNFTEERMLRINNWLEADFKEFQ